MNHDLPANESDCHYALGSITLSFNDENFYFALHAGRHTRTYVVSPKHAKRIMMLLEKDVREFEERFGELKTELPPNARNDISSTEGRQMGFSIS